MKRISPFAFLVVALLLSFANVNAANSLVYDSSGGLTSVTPVSPAVPDISAPPVTQLVSEDGDVRFTVVANGVGPISFQWLSNGVPISGAIGDSLTISNVVVPRTILTNGSFELPVITPDFLMYLAGSSFGGWNVETGNVDLVHYFWNSADGFQSMDLNGSVAGAIYQDVSTTPGQQYFLRFALAGNTFAAPTVKSNVLWWNGAPISTNIFSITGHSGSDMGWTNFEFAVIATSNLTRLKFASISTGGNGPALDDVSLIPAPPAFGQYSVIVSNSSGSVTSSVAMIEFDTEDNGLPDSWERTYFAGTGQFPDTDSDGDGVSNADEYREGTNPTDAGSFRPRLNLNVWPGGAVAAQTIRASYALDEVVQITAQADFGAMFLRWTGDITNTVPVTNVVMDATKNINAIFGTTLASGMNIDGTIVPSGTNYYAFTANTGDTVVLRCGELSGTASFQPWLRVYGPGAVPPLLVSVANASDAFIAYRATNNGTFTVTVSSGVAAQSGNYRLHFIRIPDSFVIPPGDEGGAMTNGGNYIGTTDIGDEDIWTFTANASNSIVLRCGKLSGTASYAPWVRIYGANGALLAQDNHASDAYLAYQTTNSGTFTVLVGSANVGNVGSYQLHFAQAPAAFIVLPGDEGGPLTIGGNHDGTNDIGDEDLWSFTANTGDTIVLRAGETSGTASYTPWLRIYGSTGALLTQNANASDALITYRATNSGTFTVLMGSSTQGHTGSYRLRYMKIPGVFVVPSGDEGGSLTNGTGHDGITELGDEDIWTFTANSGDNVILRCGKIFGVGFYTPWIRLYGSNGVLLAQDNNFTDAYIAYQTTNAGTFTVLAGSSVQGTSGSYRLNFVQMPAPFTVAPGDEGGTLTNGAAHDGVTTLGDEDIWTFTANTNDTVVLRCADLSGDASYYPSLRVYGPSGVYLTGDANQSDAWVAFRATNSGTFAVTVDSYYQGYSGNYRLRYAKVPGAFVIPPGDEGGTLTNGVAHDGTNDLGDEDIWTFAANSGDTILLRCADLSGNASYYPYVRLYGSNGALLASDADQLDANISYRATNSGTFTVLVGANFQGYSGNYQLRLSKIPGAFVVPPGDEGGELVSGGNYDGSTELGDEDIWNFSANTGDNIVLRTADVSTNSSYYIFQRLYGPDGALLASDSDQADSYLAYRTTNSGTFTVVIESLFAGAAGDYRLHFMQMPGDFIVPFGDEGGAISAGVTNIATTDLGDEDIWRFTAFKAVPIALNVQEITGTASYAPWIRLYGPSGVFLAQASGAAAATINYTPTNTGSFTILAGSINRAHTGTYRIYGTGITPGLQMGAPNISGGTLTIPISGGFSNLQFTASMATNLTPPVVWIPIITNQFDASGNFTLTNTYSPGQPQKYFRFSLP